MTGIQTCALPIWATTGAVAVTNSGATSTTTKTLTVIPGITTFAPLAGTIGTLVSIHGTSFTGATSVTFNGTSAGAAGVGFTIIDDTHIDATVPAGASSGHIAVTTPSGTGTSTATFSYMPPVPVISSFLPSIPTGYNAAVTITGDYFIGVTDVRFNGVAATFSVASQTSITTTVPSSA